MGKSPLLSATLILILAGVFLFSLPIEVDAYGPTCDTGELTIRWCRLNNNVLQVRFYANTPSDYDKLKFEMVTSLGEEYAWGPLIRQGPVSNLTLEWAGRTEYILRLPVDNPISEIHISDPSCTGTDYLSDRAACEFTTTEDYLATGSSCGDYPTLEGRVRCRLYRVGTPTTDVSEECRILSGTERSQCIAEYNELTPCLHERDDASILACAKGMMGVDESVADAKMNCELLPPAEQNTCMTKLRRNTHRLTKFKFRLLEQKAAGLMWRGVSEDHIISFISNIGVRTQAYNSVTVLTEKINIVNQVQDLWSGFVFTAEPQVLTYYEDTGCGDSCE